MKFSFDSKKAHKRFSSFSINANFLSFSSYITTCRLSTMPSLNSTHWTRTHTKIRHSSCSCWETTSRYGRLTHRVMATSHQSATKINQTKFSKASRWKTNQQLSTKNQQEEEEVKFAQRNEKEKTNCSYENERETSFSSNWVTLFDYATRAVFDRQENFVFFSPPVSFNLLFIWILVNLLFSSCQVKLPKTKQKLL